MGQKFIPAVFYRGGTSKGLFFHAHDLPIDRAACGAILLAALGSPDPYGRQLDGMGGGISSLSKAVIVGPPSRPDTDIDYTFVQIAVDQPVADWSNTCGNLTSAVGHFAVDEGLIPVRDGEVLVRINQTNTGKVIHSRFLVSDGKAETGGDYAIAGVASRGSRVRLDFLDPDGAVTGKLLPTGNVVDVIDLNEAGRFEVSLIDATSLVVYVEAGALGLTGAESPDEIESRPAVMATLETLRRAAGVLAGLGPRPDAIALQTPRIALVAAPRPFRGLDGVTHAAAQFDIATRMMSMQRAHRAIPGTGGLNLGVATQIVGTIPNRLSRPTNAASEVRVGNPSGLISVGAVVRQAEGAWTADSAVLFRTARRLMQGQIAIPAPEKTQTPLRAAINLGNPVLAHRSPADGELGGVSVALARALARRSGRELTLLPFETAGKVVEACRDGAWDLAFLAIDPKRATEIAFTEPYVTIEGMFVVARDAPWRSLAEIDQPGVRIAVGQGAAYDLHLGRTLKHAELVRAPTSAAALQYFVDHGLEAAAGVRQAVAAFAESRPGLRLVEAPFMEIRQAMAIPASRAAELPALQRFLDEAMASGLVARALEMK